MTSSITQLVARELTDDLRRASGRARLTAGHSTEAKLPAIELRLAHVAEAHALTRLAALDDAPELEGPVLLALIDGEAQAGLSLHDGRVVANPFVRTGEAVALLRVRAAALPDAQTPGHRLSGIAARFAARFAADRGLGRETTSGLAHRGIV
ncbi:MAG: hypothetical protein M3Z06_01245, partial [Actinomycetota bacterium]|nr:hypothetical protein [Actinomycetota bacterium]